jgi:hypothetical protein
MLGANPPAELLGSLGKFKAGKGCLYLKRLDDIHIPTLKKLIQHAVTHLRKKYK